MKYKNTADERLRDRIKNGTSMASVQSKNKMAKTVSSARSAAFNIGKIVNRTSEYDKTNEKVQLKSDGIDHAAKERDFAIKVFSKGSVPYIKYKNNDIQVSQLPKLAQTDAGIKKLINTVKAKQAAMNDTGNFYSFLLKQYS